MFSLKDVNQVSQHVHSIWVRKITPRALAHCTFYEQEHLNYSQGALLMVAENGKQAKWQQVKYEMISLHNETLAHLAGTSWRESF